MYEDKKELNILIGKNVHGECVFLDYAFGYKDGGGLVGTLVEFHTKDEGESELEDYIDNDGLLDIWKEGVYHGNITQSYSEWCEDVKEMDGISAVYDTGYNHYSWLQEGCEIASEKDEVEYDSDYTDARGGGRCFNQEMLEDNYREWTVEENFNLFKKLYEEYEKPNDDREIVRKAKERLKELIRSGYFGIAECEDMIAKVKVPEEAKKFLEENDSKIDAKVAEEFIKKMEEDGNEC